MAEGKCLLHVLAKLKSGACYEPQMQIQIATAAKILEVAPKSRPEWNIDPQDDTDKRYRGGVDT